MKYLYLLFMIVGLSLPYSEFVPYYLNHGMNITVMVDQLFATNLTSFFGYDLFVSALVIIPFMIHEGKKIELEYYWVPILCIIGIGLSFGLPLFLYLRERHFEKVELATFLEIE